MERADGRSPVVGYKIALVNNANLNVQFVQVGIDENAMPIETKQFEYASKRMLRAIRKARKMAMDGHRNIMLFGVRKNGDHFPVNYRKTMFERQAEKQARATPVTPLHAQTVVARKEA